MKEKAGVMKPPMTPNTCTVYAGFHIEGGGPGISPLNLEKIVIISLKALGHDISSNCYYFLYISQSTQRHVRRNYGHAPN